MPCFGNVCPVSTGATLHGTASENVAVARRYAPRPSERPTPFAGTVPSKPAASANGVISHLAFLLHRGWSKYPRPSAFITNQSQIGGLTSKGTPCFRKAAARWWS